MRKPEFDIDLKIGAQSEMWVGDLCSMLAKGSGEIEVKAPKPFLKEKSAYIEYQCKGRDGNWYPSGIAQSKAKIWALTFGSLPGGLFIESDWLKRAARRAFKLGHIKECMRGSNPTKAVVVSFEELWETKEHEP